MFDMKVKEIADKAEWSLLEKAKGVEKAIAPEKLDAPIAKIIAVQEERTDEGKVVRIPRGLEAHTKYEWDGILYETDAGGNTHGMEFLPQNNGHWDGERGNSKWVPDSDYVPKKDNPDEKKWGEIMKERDIDGITFRDDEPDFSDVSRGDVEIEGFSTNRSDNFDKADIEMAKKKGCSPEEVKQWREENGYTWHECKDQRTMQKVPRDVHNNIPHEGGIAEAKRKEETEND